MSELSRIFFVDGGVDKDALNGFKDRGADTVSARVEISNGIYDNADEIIAMGKTVHEAGLKWCMKLGLDVLYSGVLAETGADNRMFVRKAERAGFENMHKLFTKLSEAGALPELVEIDTDIYSGIQGVTVSYEEQTRMVNACINAVKAAGPATMIILGTGESIDNEKSKKWFNRFQVSGGKPFDIIALSYELSSETLYDLSCNISDISRRFSAKIIVDLSADANAAAADIGAEDIESVVGIVPMDGGYGVIATEGLY